MSSLRDLVRVILPPEWSDVQAMPAGSSSASNPISNSVAVTIRSGLDDLVVRLMETIGADGMAVAFREEGEFVFKASQGFAPPVGTVIRPGEGICGICVKEGRAVVEQDLEGELRSVVAVPVYEEKRAAGVIAAFSRRAKAFREVDVETVVGVAGRLKRSEGIAFSFGREVGSRIGGANEMEQEADQEAEQIESADDYLAQMHEQLYPRRDPTR